MTSRFEKNRTLANRQGSMATKALKHTSYYIDSLHQLTAGRTGGVYYIGVDTDDGIITFEFPHDILVSVLDGLQDVWSE